MPPHLRRYCTRRLNRARESTSQRLRQWGAHLLRKRPIGRKLGLVHGPELPYPHGSSEPARRCRDAPTSAAPFEKQAIHAISRMNRTETPLPLIGTTLGASQACPQLSRMPLASPDACISSVDERRAGWGRRRPHDRVSSRDIDLTRIDIDPAKTLCDFCVPPPDTLLTSLSHYNAAKKTRTRGPRFASNRLTLARLSWRRSNLAAS